MLSIAAYTVLLYQTNVLDSIRLIKIPIPGWYENFTKDPIPISGWYENFQKIQY
jgi:hypothetical protein